MAAMTRGTERSLEVFDQRPIELDGFTLSARSAVPTSKTISEGQWQGAIRFAGATHESSPYWIADLIAYAENRPDWRGRLEQLLSVTGLSLKRIHNIGALRKVDAEVRALAPSPEHAIIVAPLPKPQQAIMLEEANNEGWNTHELRQAIRARRRLKVLDHQAPLVGMFRVLYASPDWKTIAAEELMKMPVAAHAMPDSVLWLWVPPSRLFDNPGPREVMTAWGFTYASNYVWDTVTGRPGGHAVVSHEHLVIGTRGTIGPEIPIDEHHFDSVQTVRRRDEFAPHPEEFRKLIDRLYPTGPKLQLFAEGKGARGWQAVGSDPKLWSAEVQAD